MHRTPLQPQASQQSGEADSKPSWGRRKEVGKVTLRDEGHGFEGQEKDAEINNRDFPGGPAAKTLCSQCRDPRFDPW